MFTTFDPMRPVPPITTIFIFLFLVSDALSFITNTSSYAGGPSLASLPGGKRSGGALFAETLDGLGLTETL
jgi:hypothetical protein